MLLKSRITCDVTICKMFYFVARVRLVGLVGCALEFLDRIGLGIGLELGLVFGCILYVAS